MSYGTRKAIAGTMRGGENAHLACVETIRRFDACATGADIRAVLAWDGFGGKYFLRSKADSEAMREAFERARKRVNP
jgi:hypothetical protein